MAVTRVTTVTWVCTDYDSDLKIGPNEKKMGLDCWARQALFDLRMTTIYETLDFETPPYWNKANFGDCNIASKHKTKHTRTQTPKDAMMNPVHVHVIELHYSHNANEMLVLFWTPSTTFLLRF